MWRLERKAWRFSGANSLSTKFIWQHNEEEGPYIWEYLRETGPSSDKSWCNNGDKSPEDITSLHFFLLHVWICDKHAVCFHLSYLSWAIRWNSRCCFAVRRTGAHPPSARPHSHLRTRRSSLRTRWLRQNGPAWGEEKPSPTGWWWCRTWTETKTFS